MSRFCVATLIHSRKRVSPENNSVHGTKIPETDRVVDETYATTLNPERYDALLAAWRPGEAAGDAIARLLFGDVSPSARLTQA